MARIPVFYKALDLGLGPCMLSNPMCGESNILSSFSSPPMSRTCGLARSRELGHNLGPKLRQLGSIRPHLGTT